MYRNYVLHRPTNVLFYIDVGIKVSAQTLKMPIEATALHIRSDDSMSDHRMIRFAIKRDKPASIWCRNVKRTNWQLYEDELKESISLWFGQVETPRI